jgi:hypothetical protein
LVSNHVHCTKAPSSAVPVRGVTGTWAAAVPVTSSAIIAALVAPMEPRVLNMILSREEGSDSFGGAPDWGSCNAISLDAGTRRRIHALRSVTGQVREGRRFGSKICEPMPVSVPDAGPEGLLAIVNERIPVMSGAATAIRPGTECPHWRLLRVLPCANRGTFPPGWSRPGHQSWEHRMKSLWNRASAVALGGAVLLSAACVDQRGVVGPELSATVTVAAAAAALPNAIYTMTLTPADMPEFFPPEAVEMLTGTWELDFTDPRSYSVRLDGVVLIFGRFTATPTRLIMRDLGGPLACLEEPRHAQGVYEWTLSDDGLVLSVVTDHCAGRPFVLTVLPWQKL